MDKCGLNLKCPKEDVKGKLCCMYCNKKDVCLDACKRKNKACNFRKLED